MALLVKTKSGTGVVVGERAGKLMVEIVNDNMSQKLKDGKPLRVLCHKLSAIPVGFVCGYKQNSSCDNLEDIQVFIGANNDISIEDISENEQDDSNEQDDW